MAAHSPEPSGIGHLPVMPSEVIRLLDPRPGEIAVDCTVGRGGHSLALAEAVGPDGLVVGFDVDPDELAFAAQRLRDARFEAVCESFVRAPRHLRERGLRADVALADLGLSSGQLDDPERGFGFSSDGPLDMRLDPKITVNAAELVATASERELADLIRRYGEDPYAEKIARKLVRVREQEPISSTAQLARIVREAYGPRARSSRMHPATRTFMALRIAVNDELTALRALLEQIQEDAAASREGGWLRHGARLGIISFHSLEDRLVKRTFADLAKRGLGTLLTKRPVTASDQEIADNPRARSAKLRVVRIHRGDPETRRPE